MGASQSYALTESYTPSTFFSKFNFLSGADPSHGFTNFVNYDVAKYYGLIPNPSVAKFGVDSVNVLPTSAVGRPSIRMTSKSTYNHGLFIADIAHMPSTTCGLWPSFWLLGQTGAWPQSGELDIIEGVNKQGTNLMSAHTTDSCTITGTNQTGALTNNNCALSSGTQGCGVSMYRTTSYGDGFNNIGGGVYATQWTSNFMKIWFFERTKIPASISNGKPTPDVDFGTPAANFAGNCNMDTHFYNMSIVIDTTFCGDWGAAVYFDTCPAVGSQNNIGSCVSQVANNPTAYKNAYWQFNSINVYQLK